MTQFKVGQIYKSNFVGDHNLHCEYKVIKRTAKFVTFLDLLTNREFKVKPHVFDNVEHYSHCGEHIKAA